MSLNEITSPNTYVPEVAFRSLTISEKETLPKGTALNPSLQFSGDIKKAGLYQPADGWVSIASNGATVANFRSLGDGTNIISPFYVEDNILNTRASFYNSAPATSVIKLDANQGAELGLCQSINGNYKLSLHSHNTPFPYTNQMRVDNTSELVFASQQNAGDYTVGITTSANGGLKLYKPGLSGYSPTVLNVYEEFPTSTIINDFSTPQTVNFSIVRIGKICHINISGVETTFGALGSAVSMIGILPARFRPSQECFFQITTVDAIYQPAAPNQLSGLVRVLTNGDVVIYATSNNGFFNSGSLTGWKCFNLSFNCS